MNEQEQLDRALAREDSTSARMDVQIASIETQVSIIYRKLFGNGQPGILDKIEQRLSESEKFVYMCKGALYVISAILALLTGTVMVRITMGKG